MFYTYLLEIASGAGWYSLQTLLNNVTPVSNKRWVTFLHIKNTDATNTLSVVSPSVTQPSLSVPTGEIILAGGEISWNPTKGFIDLDTIWFHASGNMEVCISFVVLNGGC